MENALLSRLQRKLRISLRTKKLGAMESVIRGGTHFHSKPQLTNPQMIFAKRWNI